MMTHATRQALLGKTITAGLILALLGGMALALDADGDEPITTEPAAVIRNTSVMAPVVQAVKDLYDAAHVTQLELEAELAAAPDPAAAIEIQRAIEQLKCNTEIEMFRIQKRHAEQRGDAATVAVLTEVLEQLAPSAGEDETADNQAN